MMVKELENNCCFEEWKKASTWGIFLTSYYKTISIGTSFGRNTFHSYLGSIQFSWRLQRFQRFWTILLYLPQKFCNQPIFIVTRNSTKFEVNTKQWSNYHLFGNASFFYYFIRTCLFFLALHTHTKDFHHGLHK